MLVIYHSHHIAFICSGRCLGTFHSHAYLLILLYGRKQTIHVAGRLLFLPYQYPFNRKHSSACADAYTFRLPFDAPQIEIALQNTFNAQ